MLSFLNFLIRWSFYTLFALVPIIFTGNTSELFEFNKMWLTFILTLLIAASWICKSIIERQIKIIRTPLDIPILLFLLSQTISTIFSLDSHVSLWGYYSRFNGGLLSLLSYAFLYFAFVSFANKQFVMKCLYTILGSGIFVALWGLPSHFGYDPTCLVFRGTFDVSCWTFAFQPKVRIFSTLGQPDWLAAYLVYVLPLSIVCTFIFAKAKRHALSIFFLAITGLFYLDLLYTEARSGFVGIAAALLILLGYYLITEWKSFTHRSLVKSLKEHTIFLGVIGIIVAATFVVGSPFAQLDKFTLGYVTQLLHQEKQAQTAKTLPATTTTPPTQELGGTDSGKIRLFVWQGAIQIFLHNPLFGTGVETFAYAYYQYRPAGHNLTSEWDYLYNKAHNEYLNYLATTGIIGLATYMVMIGYGLWLMGYGLWKPKSVKDDTSTLYATCYMQLGLLAGYVSILVTNFFGFSVVIMNILLFLTPAFVFFLDDSIETTKVWEFPKSAKTTAHVSEAAWIGIGAVGLVFLYFLIVLTRFWLADVSYAYGMNLDHANEYQAAYSYLHDAVNTRPSEPTFQAELSANDAVLSVALAQQKDTTNADKLAQESVQVSDNLAVSHPNDVTLWKTRVRVMYTLSQINPQYLSVALTAIQKAAQLAPTDAKVSYNLGLLYGQTGNLQKAVETLQNTIALKPDYRDAYYAQALFYRQLAVDSNKRVINQDNEQKAVDDMHYIEAHLDSQNSLKIPQTLSSWGEK